MAIDSSEIITPVFTTPLIPEGTHKKDTPMIAADKSIPASKISVNTPSERPLSTREFNDPRRLLRLKSLKIAGVFQT